MKGILLLASLGALTLAGCQTAGTGSGREPGTRKPVAFTWQSTDSISGNMTATFGTGRVFRGTFFQITSETRVDRLNPLWDGWGRPYRRSSWRHWAAESDSQFIKTYSGQVVANLHGDEGEHMRCQFNLISPSRGMAGGGEGRCQMSDSEQELTAEFPRHP